MAATLSHVCGWSAKPTGSPAQQAFGFRQHSCARQVALAERRARVQARLNDPGVKRECEHKIARHIHGTYAAYVLDRCKCRPCRVANSVYEGIRAKRKAYGTWAPYVNAGPARAHVLALMGEGIGLKQIVKLSGVPQGTLWKLIYGKRNKRGRKVKSKQIRLATESALLAVAATAEAFAGGAKVDSTRSIVELRMLVAAGWSQSKLAARLNVNGSNFGAMMLREQLRASTVREIHALYLELRYTAPPEATHREKISCSRARNLARSRGWKPPPTRDVRLMTVVTEPVSREPYGWVAGVAATMRSEAS